MGEQDVIAHIYVYSNGCLTSAMLAFSPLSEAFAPEHY